MIEMMIGTTIGTLMIISAIYIGMYWQPQFARGYNPTPKYPIGLTERENDAEKEELIDVHYGRDGEIYIVPIKLPRKLDSLDQEYTLCIEVSISPTPPRNDDNYRGDRTKRHSKIEDALREVKPYKIIDLRNASILDRYKKNHNKGYEND